MGVKNKVIAGDYDKKDIFSTFGDLSISVSFGKTVPLNKETIDEYEVIDEDKRKSATSAVGRGLVGGIAGTLLLGPIGIIGGLAGLSAKTKGTHIIAIQFKDGKKSLIQMNDKYYSSFMKKMF